MRLFSSKVLEVLDGQPAGGIVGADIVVLLNQQLDAVDAAFELLSVVDVDVAGQGRLVVLVDLDDGVEQPVDALPAAADGGMAMTTRRFMSMIWAVR